MSKPTTVDPRIKEWASDSQIKYIDAVIEYGSLRAAAVALGVNFTTVRQAIVAAQTNAARRLYSPEHHLTRPIAPGLKARGTSQLFKQGQAEPVLEWVKTSVDEDAQEEFRKAIIDALQEEVRGLAPLTPLPETTYSDLLALYPLGDPHHGQYSWAKECGDAFDIKEAERLTWGAVDRLVASAPPAATAIVLPLGDVFHANDQTNETPAHKNRLDVDSRYPKVLASGIQTFRRVIQRALEKHLRVIVRIESGNHDPEAKWALAFALSAYFENEPRVEVDLTPGKFWYFQFGKVLIASTHGDTAKHAQLGGIMAADRPVEWGATTQRHWYTGHVHSSHVTEFPGVICESFRTLAAKDAYAAGHGYRAGRDMRCIVHHREFGEIERHRCDVAMID